MLQIWINFFKVFKIAFQKTNSRVWLNTIKLITSKFISEAYLLILLLTTKSICVAQIDMAKIVTIQKKVSPPNCTDIRPSFLVSQCAVAADCKPEPLFYIMMQVTAYLNGFINLARSLMQASIIYWHH